MSCIPRIKFYCVKYVVTVRQSPPYYCSSCETAKGLATGFPAFTNRSPQSRHLSTIMQLQPSKEDNSVDRKTTEENVQELMKRKNRLARMTKRPMGSLLNQVEAKANVKPSTKAVRNLNKSEREIAAKLKMEELSRSGKELSLNKNLLSYIQTCLFLGDRHRAMKTLNYYRQRSEGSRIKDIAIYNVLLHGFAAEGNLSQVKDIFKLLGEDGLKPTPQTFAAVIECLGRNTSSSTFKKNMKRTISSLKASGYKLDDIFNATYFEKDQREVILAAIQLFDPNYVPQIRKPSSGYVCGLLRHLNNSDGTYFSPAAGLISDEELLRLTMEQFENELRGTVTIKSIERKAEEENTSHFRSTLTECEDMWMSAIKVSLARSLNSLFTITQRHKSPWAISLYPFLKVLSPEEYAKILLLEIRKLAEGSETYSPSVTQLYRELGVQVQNRYQTQHKTEAGILNKIQEVYEQYIRWYMNPDGHSKVVNPRQKWQQLLFQDNYTGPHIDIREREWPGTVVSGLGRFLYEIIMQDIKIDANMMKLGQKTKQMVPAFYSIFRSQGMNLKQEIKPHPVLVRLFQAASRDELHFETSQVPMLCPPMPWASIRTGGYLLSAAKLVRLPFTAYQQLHRMENCNQDELYPALDCLNQLSSIPWKINEEVLDVIIEVFNSKGNELLGVPPPPSECPTPPAIEQSMTKAEAFAIHKQRLLLKRRKAEMYSLWCDALYRLSLANHFRKGIFWLPHNMDFRGRVYPCPPHLTHLGADTARAILVFAKGEPLGESGLDWLKIHCINLTGLKKRESVADRLAFANEMLHDILDSAERPLTGRKWWMGSDEPWQTLSCCMEIRNAIRSGDPAAFVSHYPIHQDGSCNGLQHYAALGRDQAGAESVNLAPSEVPQDVYSSVAALVERLRQRDAEEGVKIAKALEGFIRRKVIKQTVMTTVYGVTRYGARLQIAKQLKDIPDFPKDCIWQASTYLTAKTFESLQEMFTSTKEIQDWFTQCAKMISQVCGQNVEWVTPLGLPVVQPYFRIIKSKFEAFNPAKLSESHYFDMYERPNVMKQKNAFPPNYIHSLDSSHMMLTSLNCERTGMTFVSVHDCFWTHPKTVHEMNRICREQFVALHSEPILEDLSKFLIDRYSYAESDIVQDGSLVGDTKRNLNHVLKAVPPKGTFDLRNVLNSVYFFS